MPASTMRHPTQLIDDTASRRGMATPLPAYFPLGRSFAEACVREAYLDVIDELTDVTNHAQEPGEVRAGVQSLIERLRGAVQVE